MRMKGDGMGQGHWRHRATALIAGLGLACSAGIALAPGTASAQTRATSPQESLADLRKQEDRIVTIGERISVAAANAGWCDPGQSLGWTLGEIGQYPKPLRQAVKAQWRLPEGAVLFVASVAPDGAAAQAGVTPGMAIVTLAGRSPMRNPYAMPSRHALDVSERLIARTLENGPLQFETIAADGARRGAARRHGSPSRRWPGAAGRSRRCRGGWWR